MKYAKLNESHDAVEIYPYTLGQLRRDNPKVSFPSDPDNKTLLDYNVVVIESTDRPSRDEMTQDIIEGTPESVDGVWKQQWNVVEADEVEKERRLTNYREDLACTPWQLRKALNALGLRQQVEDYIATPDTPQDVKDGWEFASEFKRTDALVTSAGAALGKSEAEMDQLFELAVSL